MPVDSDSKVAPKMDSATQERKLNLRMAAGGGKSDSHPWPPRGCHCEVPVVDRRQGRGVEDPSSTWSSRRRERESEKWTYEESFFALCAPVPTTFHRPRKTILTGHIK